MVCLHSPNSVAFSNIDIIQYKLYTVPYNNDNNNYNRACTEDMNNHKSYYIAHSQGLTNDSQTGTIECSLFPYFMNNHIL